MLVASFYVEHQHHAPSLELFLRFNRKDACCAAHSLAEVYAVLTGRTGRDRVSGDEAMLFLGNVREHLTLVTLDREEYFAALETCATLGLTSGGIYDGLLGHCALKVDAKSIYTWNVRDFRRLGPMIEARLKTP